MPIRTLQAVYEDGILRPVVPLCSSLREHQKVTLTLLVDDAEPAGERLDLAYLATVASEAEAAADLTEVRAALARIPGSLTAACIAERAER